MQFSNEAIHAAQVMYSDFERWNRGLNQFVEGKCDTLPQFYAEVLTNYDYFPDLPHDLYQNIVHDNLYISYDKRGKPLELVGKIENVIAELDQIRYDLNQYSEDQRQKEDPELKDAYAFLHRAEVLYADLFLLQEKLHTALLTIYKEYAYTPQSPAYWDILQKMESILTRCQSVIKALRLGQNSPEMNVQLQSIQREIADLQFNKNTYLATIAAIDSSAFCPHKRFTAFVQRGNEWIEKINVYRTSGNPRYAQFPRPAYYYYYNAEALSKYNRYGDGLVSIYNRFLMTSGEYALYQMEFPPIYEVLEPDTTKKPSTDPLKDYAANHLIFLLDLSTSMGDTTKLPVLKAALRSLLDLLRPEDNISILTYTGRAKIVLNPTSASDKNLILQAIDQLKYGGGSNAQEGLTLAYEIGLNHYIQGGNNRIILATDGAFKLEKAGKRIIQKGANKELFLSVFYVNPTENAEVKSSLQKLAQTGKGAYRFIQKSNAESQLLLEAQGIRKKNVQK